MKEFKLLQQFLMKKIIFLICLFTNIVSYCQQYDYNILVGFRNTDTIFNDYRGITQFNFNTPSLNPVILYDSFKIMDFDWTINNMSDLNGNYIFSYDGFVIQDSANQIMPNGYGGFTRQTSAADVSYQSGLILPLTKKDNYILFHEYHYLYPTFGTYFADGLYYSVIDMNKNSGKGSVILKNKVILKDTLDYGRMLAIKHANGRDWWILRGRYDMESFYTFLLSEDSIYQYSLQKIGDHQYIPFGCAAVSQQGDKIVYISQHEGVLTGQGGVLGLFLHFFDFDRCTGLLSNPKSIQVDNRKSLLMGGAFSPNGKFFYLSRIETIYQIDMTNSNILLDTVASYDGFKYISHGNFEIPTLFGFIQLAPDGRIYGSNSSRYQQYVFTINKPNEKACDIKQHSIKITDHSAFPSFPNYRLGPIDGSSCDTLGIDNIPIAEFRYNQDTLDFLKIDFTNLSWYDPEEFWWDWGDQSNLYYTKQKDTSISHTFLKEGVFQVCLRAKNGKGENTICKEIKLGTTGTKNNEIALGIYPNPAKDFCIINLQDYLPKHTMLSVYDIFGNLKLSKRIFQGTNIIDIKSLNSGIFIIEIKEGSKIIHSDKILKL